MAVGLASVTSTVNRLWCFAAATSSAITTRELQWHRIVEPSWIKSCASSAILSRPLIDFSANSSPFSISRFLKRLKSYATPCGSDPDMHRCTSAESAASRVTKRMNRSHPDTIDTLFLASALSSAVVFSSSWINSTIVLAWRL